MQRRTTFKNTKNTTGFKWTEVEPIEEVVDSNTANMVFARRLTTVATMQPQSGTRSSIATNLVANPIYPEGLARAMHSFVETYCTYPILHFTLRTAA